MDRVFLPTFPNFITAADRERSHNQYYEGPTCLAIDNEYIPTYLMKNGEIMAINNPNDPNPFTAFLYNMLTFTPGYAGGIDTQVNGLINTYLKPRTHIGMFRVFRVAADEAGLIFNRYIIGGEIVYAFPPLDSLVADSTIKPKILLCLAVKKSSINKVIGATYQFDKNDFCLLVDKAFKNDPVHFKFYRNVKRAYIEEMSEEFDVLFTNNIENLCFKPFAPTPIQFRTIVEMNEYNDRVTLFAQENI